jgi:hypothetical protein
MPFLIFLISCLTEFSLLFDHRLAAGARFVK